MTRAIRIRPGRPEDAAAIAGFQQAMARETEGLELEPQAVAQGVEAVFEDSRRGRYLVAQVAGGGELVGCLLLTPEWSDWRNATLWWIQSVYVAPAYRRQGIYRALYRRVQMEARTDPGVRGLRLYVHRENATARAAYRALGMDGEHYQLFEWMEP
jgi:L-amino acid N-acyltransferase YncA